MKILINNILIISFLFLGSLFAQDTHNDLIKKYLWLKKELNTKEIENTKDIDNLIYYLDLIIKEDSSIYNDTSLEFYFSELDYSFYKFVAIGTVDEPYVQIVAIDKEKNIINIADPVFFINNIIPSFKINSSLFKSIVNIYNRIHFVNQVAKFYTEFESSIFGSKATFELFNNIETDKNKFSLMKMFKIEEHNFTDRYQISYIIENNTFSIIKLLVSRN